MRSRNLVVEEGLEIQSSSKAKVYMWLTKQGLILGRAPRA